MIRRYGPALNGRDMLGITAVLGAALALTACVSSPPAAPAGPAAQPAEVRNTNPRTGWVMVWGEDDEVKKRCDGPNLVYDGVRTMAIVPNSAECSG